MLPMEKLHENINRSNIKIAELRTFLGLTMAEFAEILGVSQSYVSQIEAGKRDVTSQLIYRLMDKFHMKAESIFKD